MSYLVEGYTLHKCTHHYRNQRKGSRGGLENSGNDQDDAHSDQGIDFVKREQSAAGVDQNIKGDFTSCGRHIDVV